MNGLPLSQLQVRDIQSNTDLLPIIRSTGQGHYQNYIISASTIPSLMVGFTASVATLAETAITASYSLYSISSSHLIGTASYAINSISASFSQQAYNSNTATTASYALFAEVATAGDSEFATSASWASSSISASFSSTARSASHALVANNAISASTAINATNATFATTATNATYATTIEGGPFVWFNRTLLASGSMTANTTSSWTTLNATTAGVPTNATAILLWIETTQLGTENWVEVYGRKNSSVSSPIISLYLGRYTNLSNTVGSKIGNQSILPCENGSFQYRTIGGSSAADSWWIYVYGYIK